MPSAADLAFTDPDTVELRGLLGALMADVAALAREVAAATELQWQAAPCPAPTHDSEGRRVTGVFSDPTSRVALDERRLAVRRAVRVSLGSIHAARQQVSAERARLDEAVARFEGRPADEAAPQPVAA